MTGTVYLVSPEALESTMLGSDSSKKFGSKKGGALRLGVLDNGKGNADHFLKLLVKKLQQELEIESIAWLRKFSMSSPSPENIIADLSAKADVVLSAIAD